MYFSTEHYNLNGDPKALCLRDVVHSNNVSNKFSIEVNFCSLDQLNSHPHDCKYIHQRRCLRKKWSGQRRIYVRIDQLFRVSYPQNRQHQLHRKSNPQVLRLQTK